jgi:putative SOS response-associated peptidase YedK
MCGRYTLAGNMVNLEKHFKAKLLGEGNPTSYNIAPTQLSPIILNTAPDELRFETWGLVPFWTKPDEKPRMVFNSRSDTLLSKPSFKRYLQHKRCLIPATGFFEWKAEGKIKQPYYIRLKSQKLFAFAGIWEVYANEDAEVIHTYSIITTEPNELMSGIHSRMPVILPPEHEQDWLMDSNVTRISTLLVPFETAKMEAFPVSTDVNSARNNHSQLIEKVELGRLF